MCFSLCSARCELVYNEAQSEVALWRAKYDAEIVARAVHCDTNVRSDAVSRFFCSRCSLSTCDNCVIIYPQMTRKMEEALNVSSTLLASALAVCPIFTTSRLSK